MKIPVSYLSTSVSLRLVPWLGRLPAFHRSSGRGRTVFLALVSVGLGLAAQPVAQAQETGALTTVYGFHGLDGTAVDSTLALGSDGNFYGTTAYGGPDYTGINEVIGYGTIFKLTPAGVLTTLYKFTGGSDGHTPGQILEGTDGNFYGTTSAGTNKDGTVFKVTPTGTLTTLHTFTGGADGNNPVGGISLGSDGNFYGTTLGDGTSTFGTVYKITPTGVLTTLYTFTGSEGAYPGSAPLQGSDGNFYGTTSGGASGYGTVYQMTPAGALTTLVAFTDGKDGAVPVGELVQGTDGSFYGTTHGDASTTFGTVFKVTSTGTLTTLYTFTNSADGSAPVAALIQGGDGNFYGTNEGDSVSTYGSIFQVTPEGAFTTLYTFDGSNGAEPQAGLVLGSDGNFYGGTAGLTFDNGTVYQLTVHPAFFTGETALGNGVYYLTFPSGNYFGYYSFLTNPNYLYHFDLGYEYVFDANDGKSGVYLYDFASSDFFYTSPTFPFPYLYDFGLNSTVYYYPDPTDPGHYNTDGVRYFYVFDTGKIISK